MMMMRFMTALALSGWLAFAAVWLHQPHGPATPAAAVLAPAMLVRDGGDGVPVGVGGGVVSSYPLARGPASTDSVIEIPLGKTPKLAGGTFLPPNAKPRGGSFAAGFPKQWGAPGTSQQDGQATTACAATDTETHGCRSTARRILARLSEHSYGLALRDGTCARHFVAQHTVLRLTSSVRARADERHPAERGVRDRVARIVPREGGCRYRIGAPSPPRPHRTIEYSSSVASRHDGQGSGLLAMLAAKAGATHVYTIEANPDFARLASEIVELNHLNKKVTVLNTLSTKVKVKEGARYSPPSFRHEHSPGLRVDCHSHRCNSYCTWRSAGAGSDADGTQYISQKADVLVAEIIGTLLLSESQLDYIEDARSKLLVDGGIIIPASGRQFVTLISMPILERVFEIDHYRGLVRRAAAATPHVFTQLSVACFVCAL